jgi:hypothetical protein
MDFMSPKTPKALTKEMTQVRKGRKNLCNLRDQVTWGKTFAEVQSVIWPAGQQDMTAKQPSGGQLNPTWVEWLMGWPIGSTDLKPLEMDKYQQFLQKHGEF